MQILFLGAPGAGKGTQCKRIAAKLGLPHLSSGDLLREAVKIGTASGIKAKSFMEQGLLVPDDILIDMFREKLSTGECAGGFILDGFPRNVTQAQALDVMLHQIKKSLTMVIDIAVDSMLLTRRIVGRRVCTNKVCAACYHVEFAPPKQGGVCDICGGELVCRSDDKEELVGARLKTYNEQTAPLIEYYKNHSTLATIDGNGLPDEIFTQIMKTLKVPV